MTSHERLEPLWIELALECDEEHPAFQELLLETPCGSSSESPRRHVLYFPIDKIDPEALLERLQGEKDLRVERCGALETKNWTLQSAEVLKPVQAGHFRVTPVFEEGKSRETANENEILIWPGFGFGTGHHPTTRIALELIGDLGHHRVSQSFDIGTGSGVLAIAAAKLFPRAQHVGFDIDPLAIENARQNVRLNSLEERVDFVQGSLESLVPHVAPELVIANLVAGTLCELAPLFPSSSVLIMTGFTPEQEAELEKFSANWDIQRRIELESWVGYQLCPKDECL